MNFIYQEKKIQHKFSLNFFLINRFMGEYTDYPADYAEVTSFKRTPSEYSGQSPAAYATTTLIGSSKLPSSDINRYNMFYTTDIYPPNAAVPNQINNNNNNNNNYNNSNSRNVYSDSYYDPNGKVNGVGGNRMHNTMAPNIYNQYGSNKISTAKRNRLKLMRPQNFRLNFSNQHEQQQLYIKVGELNSQNQPSSTLQTPQSQNSGSINWNPQNFNIYENHLHDHQINDTVTSASENRNNVNDKEYVYAGGNRSIISYTSAKDFPENV